MTRTAHPPTPVHAPRLEPRWVRVVLAFAAGVSCGGALASSSVQLGGHTPPALERLAPSAPRLERLRMPRGFKLEAERDRTAKRRV